MRRRGDGEEAKRSESEKEKGRGEGRNCKGRKESAKGGNKKRIEYKRRKGDDGGRVKCNKSERKRDEIKNCRGRGGERGGNANCLTNCSSSYPDASLPLIKASQVRRKYVFTKILLPIPNYFSLLHINYSRAIFSPFFPLIFPGQCC